MEGSWTWCGRTEQHGRAKSGVFDCIESHKRRSLCVPRRRRRTVRSQYLVKVDLPPNPTQDPDLPLEHPQVLVLHLAPNATQAYTLAEDVC